MNFDDYQHKIYEFALYPEVDSGSLLALSYTALGLTGEAGEYAEKVNKLMRDGTFNKQEAAKELGDVLWYLTRAASEIGYNLKDIAELNIEKLTSRKERSVLHGSGDNR